MLRAAVRSGPKAWLGILALVAVLIWLIHLNGGRQEQPAAQDLTKATTDNSPKDLPGWENTRWSMTEKQVRAAVTSPLDVPRSKAEQPSGNKWYMPFLIRNAEVEGFHCEARFFFDKRSKALDTVYLQLRENSDTSSTEAAQQKAIFERMVATVTKRYGKYTAKKDRSSSGVHNEETIWTFPSSVLAVQYFGVEGSPAVFSFQYQSPDAPRYSERSMEPAATEATASLGKPSAPPPSFRVFRSKLDEGTSVIVPSNTTDDQLRSLLWFFRERVRSHHFKEIGITHPTSKQWGKEGYLSGTISVYCGEKCAGEDFTDYNGPCVGFGIDSHEAAVYQWGLLVDGAFNTDADSGAIYLVNEFKDRKLTEIFSYKDHWQLPAPLQAEVDTEKKAAEEKSKLGQMSRKMLFAEELQGRLKASGFDITVWARDEQSEELALDSDMFKDTATRVGFLRDALPKWRRDLCAAGFRQVRLIRGGLFSTGDAYSIGCK